MSDYMGDLSNYYATQSAANRTSAVSGRSNLPPGPMTEDRSSLNMQDFLNLIVTELKSQSIDSTADTSEMLNQMVMMQMVTTMTNMTDASIMGYAASLVGKTVTVGQFDGNGKLQEIVGTVTGTGTMNGQQVVFVDDKVYFLSDIMAVGKLPAKPEKPEEGGQKPPVPPEGEKPEEGSKPQEDKPVSPAFVTVG